MEMKTIFVYFPQHFYLKLVLTVEVIQDEISINVFHVLVIIFFLSLSWKGTILLFLELAYLKKM